MKSLARSVLKFLARRVLRRYHPQIIAIAGSIGKTATKEAVTASSDDFRSTVGNFNGVVGVAVTILSDRGVPANLGQWWRVVWGGLVLLISRRSYPKVLVLEYGTDKPGDLQEILSIARPHITVLSSIAPEHLEFFHSLQGVEDEEWQAVSALGEEGTAVLNIDDQRINHRRTTIPGPVVTYGWSSQAMIRAESMTVKRNERGLPTGLMVKVAIEGSLVPMSLPGVIGRHQAYPVLAALAVARVRQQPVQTTIERFAAYQPPPGRMRLFAGLDQSLIIDDTYNASPTAMAAALTTLMELEIPGRKYVILGQMSELGAAATAWHEKTGQQITYPAIARLITLGPLAKVIGATAIAHGFPPDQVENVATPEAAAAVVQAELHAGDVVLLKGSRFASQLERAVVMLLAEPDRDRQFLVRHG